MSIPQAGFASKHVAPVWVAILTGGLVVLGGWFSGIEHGYAGGSGATYTVDTTSDASLTGCTGADPNDCSLRGAIIRANSLASPQDFIVFDPTDFPAATPATISIGSMVGSLTGGGDIIDALDRGVIIDAVNVEPGQASFSCLRIDSDNNFLRGLQVTDCIFGIEVTAISDANQIRSNVLYDNQTGLVLAGNNNQATLNLVGPNAAGTTVHPDGGNNNGVLVLGDSNHVGGDGTNVISGNLNNGVAIATSASFTTVTGNYIGTDVTGTIDLGNGPAGVDIDGTNSTIGGDTTAERNVISGNNSSGIAITGAGVTGNAILGNFIGTTADGTGALGNTSNGIFIQDAPGNCIGGTFVAAVCTPATGTRNVISGNGANGLEIILAATGNSVYGNYIGLQADGVSQLGNGSHGVVISASNNRIGDFNMPNTRNRIAYNNGDGVSIGSGTGNQVFNNGIFENVGLGIDLGPNGVTPNDLDDPDTGANNLQNFPVLTSATSIGSGTTILGTFNGAPNTEINFEYFASSSCDPSGFGEGETLVGTGGVITDANGDAVVNDTIPASVPGLRFVTASAGTDLQPSSTSEFSNCVQVPPIVVNSAAHPGDGACTLANCTLNEAIIAANTAPELSVIHFAIGSGPQTIAVTGELNQVAAQAWINGTTQPGYAGTPIIEIDGTNAEEGSSGLRLLGPGNIVEGLVINRSDEYGMMIASETNVIRNNYIGTDIAGTGDLGNGLSGIYVTASNNVIGGDTVADRNVISGNSGNGVLLMFPAAFNTVSGNYIGVNAAGTGALGNTQDGVELNDSSDNTIGSLTPGGGNVISGNGASGVELTAGGAIANRVLGNHIGVNAAGTAALANGQSGVRIANGADANLIGGTETGSRNVISGHPGSGVLITGAGTIVNSVQGNYIGTNAAGSTGLSPSQQGVEITGGATQNTVGGTSAGAGNVLSGNGAGVLITGSASDNNTVQGNLIGTNPAGTAVVPNENGVFIADASGTLVGGAVAGARNVISGNSLSAVQIQNAGANGNIIKGNYIGTDATGMVGLGNGGYGVLVVFGNGTVIGGTTAAETNVIAATGPDGFGGPGYGILLNSDNNNVVRNLIGTAADGVSPLGNEADGIFIATNNNTIGHVLDPALGNTIAYNGGGGVVLAAGVSSGNFIRSNSIFRNAGLGIDLGDDGVTVNDTNDSDTGANGLQNNASITGITVNPPNVTINGILGSAASQTYFVELFVSDNCDPSSFGEGQTFIGRIGPLTTSIFGTVGFTFNTTTAVVPDGSFATTTATHSSGSTSEFSVCATAVDDDDDDNDGFLDATETPCGSFPKDPLSVPERTDTAGDDDGDGLVNEPLPGGSGPHDCDADGATGNTEASLLTNPQDPDTDDDGDLDSPDTCPLWPNPSQALPTLWTVPAGDSDCDGFTNTIETYLGTDPTLQCAANTGINNEPAPDRWPVDMNDNRLANTIDIGQLVFTLNESNPNHPGANTNPEFNPRHDFNGNGTINTIDVGRYVFVLNESCLPSGP